MMKTRASASETITAEVEVLCTFISLPKIQNKIFFFLAQVQCD